MELTKATIPRTGGISQVKITESQRAFRVSTTTRDITAHAGAVLIRAAARAVGLGTAVEDHLRLKKRARGLTEGQFLAGMSEAKSRSERHVSMTSRSRVPTAPRKRSEASRFHRRRPPGRSCGASLSVRSPSPTKLCEPCTCTLQPPRDRWVSIRHPRFDRPTSPLLCPSSVYRPRLDEALHAAEVDPV